MSKINFKVNNKLEILWNNKYYKSTIQDVVDSQIAMSIPTVSGSYVPLGKGDRIEVLYYDDLNLYKFNTVVVGRKFEGIPIIMLKEPEKVVKIQRRKFVRVSCIKYINYKKVSLHKSNINFLIRARDTGDEEKQYSAILIDLSGGGMRLKVSEKISIGENIIVDLPLGEEEFKVKGEIVRVEKDMDGKNECGVNFSDIDNRVREKIIGFIFKLMREQAKKG